MPVPTPEPESFPPSSRASLGNGAPRRYPAVLGLGYIGIPLATAFARNFPRTVGFDIDEGKVRRLLRGEDPTFRLDPNVLQRLELTSDPERLRDADFYVVAVPTPIDETRRPDLGPLRAACRTVGRVLSKGDVVVVESTVYPGATEEELAPLLGEVSGLRPGVDFHLGYSPERINPGDTEHTLETITKVVAGDDAATLEVLAECYGAIVPAGVYRAPSIRVAEAAKAIENVQRDLNIALMNELAMLFDRLGIETQDVLDTAATKWNFHRFHPGLVGGHCIGVDPYYLTMKAEAVGFHPQVILAGRRINQDMGLFVAAKTVKLLHAAGRGISGARVAVLGMAFKPEVRDARGSRVPDIVRELRAYGAEALVHDPLVDEHEVMVEHGIEVVRAEDLAGTDAVVLATPHRVLRDLAVELVSGPSGAPLLVDVLSAVDRERIPAGVVYWRL